MTWRCCRHLMLAPCRQASHHPCSKRLQTLASSCRVVMGRAVRPRQSSSFKCRTSLCYTGSNISSSKSLSNSSNLSNRLLSNSIQTRRIWCKWCTPTSFNSKLPTSWPASKPCFNRWQIMEINCRIRTLTRIHHLKQLCKPTWRPWAALSKDRTRHSMSVRVVWTATLTFNCITAIVMPARHLR